jgi:hypothetical protein
MAGLGEWLSIVSTILYGRCEVGVGVGVPQPLPEYVSGTLPVGQGVAVGAVPAPAPPIAHWATPSSARRTTRGGIP